MKSKPKHLPAVAEERPPGGLSRFTRIDAYHALGRRRRERVPVGLAIDAQPSLPEEAHRRGWQFVNLWLYNFKLPAELVPRGALVKLLPDDAHVQALRKQGCAVVRLGQESHPGDAAVPAVLPDLLAEGRMTAEHFFERGFQHVGYYGSDPWADLQPLYQGLAAQAKERGMGCHLHRFRRREDVHSVEDLAIQKKQDFMVWLDKVPKPIGLLAFCDWHAAQMCAWVAEARLRVPEDVAVLSRGTSPEICACSMPTISSFVRDDEGLVHAACGLLARMMAGEPAPKQPIMIPPKGIVERESTSVLATPDRVVAAALRYMWDHLDLDISVDDAAREVDLSSRQLARRFQHALNRTFREELLRRRLEETKRLLRSTDHAIADMGPMVGFRTNTYLYRAFRAAFGMTPSQYRGVHRKHVMQAA